MNATLRNTAIAASVVAAIATAYGLYQLGMKRGMDRAPTTTAITATASAENPGSSIALG